jgi:hypothetical protein
MDDLRLDGNTAAGTLGEIFSFEVSTAEYACGECGRIGRLGEAMVYEVRDLGTVVRFPGCENALIRLARGRRRYMVDRRETRYLATG